MYYLLLAIFTSVLVGIIIRFFHNYGVDSFQAIGINYIICIISGIIAHKGGITISSLISQPWFYYAIMLGAGFILMFNVFAIGTKKIGIALSSVSSKMSVIIPVYFGIILYNDNFNIYKITGVIFAILAFYFIFKKEKAIPFRRMFFYLPLLLFVGNGFNDSLQTFTQRTFNMENEMIFSFMVVVYISALTISIIIFSYKAIVSNYRLKALNIKAGIILGIFNFATTYFFLRSIGAFQSTFIFPVFNVSIVMLSVFAGVILFKEKLRPVNWAGIMLAIMAIIVIAIG